ncbi:MAG TPA: hypothetical protein VF365_10325 [Candidatus Limnocylindria bacterium]
MGIAALVICVVFAATIMLLTALDIADLSRLHIVIAAVVGIAHPVAYLAMLGVLLASRRVGLIPSNRSADRVFSVMRWALIALLLGMLAAILAMLIPALADPIAIAVTLVFALAHLMATAFGVTLLRGGTTSRITAGLFIAVVPAIILVVAVNLAGFEMFPAWFESVMALAFASLAYEVAFRPPGGGPA